MLVLFKVNPTNMGLGIFSVVFIIVLHSTRGQTYLTYVDDDSTCSSACDGSADLPYRTIQEGLDNIFAGALHIKAGIYTGPGNVNLSNTNAATNVIGDGSASTIIDCENEEYSRGWTLENGAFTMQGLTIRNCVAVHRSIDYNGIQYGGVWGGYAQCK